MRMAFPSDMLKKFNLFFVAQLVKNLPAMPETWVRSLGSIPGLGRSPGEGKGYPLQYSGLENSMDCIVHGVAKTRTQLSDIHFTSSTFSLQKSTNRAVLKRGSQCLSNFRFMYWASLGFSFLMCYLGCQLKKTLAPLPACQLGHMCPADLF